LWRTLKYPLDTAVGKRVIEYQQQPQEMFSQSDRVRYVEVSTEKEEENEIPFSSRGIENQLRIWLGTIGIIIAIGVAFVTGLSFGHFYREGGYKTEFRPATTVIETRQVKFDNALNWNGTNLYMEKNPTLPSYVGEPNEAIDEAWPNC
jgi:hypothetical protein